MRFGGDEYGEGYWERAEGSNYQNYADDPGWDVILNVLIARLGSDITLVEAACAKGWFVAHAMERGLDAYGFDLSPYAISKAPGQRVRERIQVHDAIDPWPVEPGSTDVVCAWEFFEHIHDENIPTVLDHMVEALVPGGELWLKTGIVIPSDHPFAGQADHDHTHVAVHDRAWWEALFEAKGLIHVPDAEAALDAAFAGRDWLGRFFVWRKPA